MYFDELDPNGHLHNTRFAMHVERATTAVFADGGFDTISVQLRPPDLRYVVRQFSVEFSAPFRGAGELVIDLRVSHLGRTSAAWSFECYSPTEMSLCATGSRTTVKVDEAGRPAPWSEHMRSVLASISEEV